VILVCNFVFARWGGSDDDGVYTENKLRHKEVGTAMYFISTIAYVTGLLEVFILTVFFFIRMFNGMPFIIVKLM